jgi:hypothetical protein
MILQRRRRRMDSRRETAAIPADAAASAADRNSTSLENPRAFAAPGPQDYLALNPLRKTPYSKSLLTCFPS